MDEFDAETERLMDEFWNRIIYKELSLEILATIPDDKIEQAILDYIDTKVSDFHSEFEIVSNMSKGFQMVESTLSLEAQVNNGGFNQFFYNPSGQYYEIVQKAIETYIREKENHELQNLYLQRTLEGFSESYKLTSLGEWDEKFYALGERLTELRLKFIRSNLQLFVGN